MKKQLIATFLGFLATFVVNTVLAMAVLGPLVNSKLGISRNPETDGLNFPAMLGGYIALAVFMVWLVRLLSNESWLKRGFTAGLATGLAVFVAGHAIVAGWSVADAGSMIFSGFVDTLATIVGGIVIAYFLKNDGAKP
jgi:hypothetical protein